VNACEYWDVDEVFVSWWNNPVDTADKTGGTPADYRVKLVSSGVTPGGSIRRVHVTRSGTTGAQASLRLFELVPNDGLVLEECECGNFQNASQVGFQLMNKGAGVRGFVPSDGSSGLTMRNCVAHNLNDGFRYSGDSASDIDLERLILDGCHFKNCLDSGIVVETTTASTFTIRSATITRCHCRGNADFGLDISSANSLSGDSVVICHNTFRDNGGGAGLRQVRMGRSGSDEGQSMYGTFYGNDLGGTTGNAFGRLYMYDAAPAFPMSLNMRGPETGYIEAGDGTHIRREDARVISDLDIMIHNVGRVEMAAA
jgi:hypothetical protein